MLRLWDLQITINVDCERAVYVQIADAIVDAIKTGKLQNGDALPGSRQLATKLKVNRNTVIDALDVLLAEGWLIAKKRKGTFVADQPPTLSKIGQPILKTADEATARKSVIYFDDGLPDTRIAPITELAAAYRSIFNRKGRWQLMGYNEGSGDLDFRSAIVQMLNYKRGMSLSAEEVFITRGSQMALFLSAQCLLQTGDYVIVENPGYKPAWDAFKHAGANLIPLAVDGDGIIIADLKTILQSGKKIKAIYITPHHQFPTTVTLSRDRRSRLVSLSNRYGFTIIEDDYDNEFHFGEGPILPVCSDENLENFIYIGTMSKIVAPALRIGYLATSRALITKIANLRKIIDVQGDNIMAQAVLQLINDGHIGRHLKKATLHYKMKRDVFDKLIQQYLGEKVSYHKPEGGLAFWLVPKEQMNIDNLTNLLLEKEVQIVFPHTFSFEEPVMGLRLGYASLNESQLEQGLVIIAKYL